LYLIDTNVWLERLLGQEKANEVGIFLDKIPSDQLYISDFSFHSIGIILSKLDRVHEFVKFIDDIFINGSVEIVNLNPEDIRKSVVPSIEKFKLDFDDAYQYIAAEKYQLQMISFDTDFDQTDIRRKTPAEIVDKK